MYPFFPMLRISELDEVLQTGSHESRVKVQNHLLGPAGHAFSAFYPAPSPSASQQGCSLSVHTSAYIHLGCILTGHTVQAGKRMDCSILSGVNRSPFCVQTQLVGLELRWKTTGSMSRFSDGCGYHLEKPLDQMDMAGFATVVWLLCAVIFSFECEALMRLSIQCKCLCF